MKGDNNVVIVPREGTGGGDWHITNVKLKLALKYGLVDGAPGSPPRSNSSVAFDAYALRRGPKSGLPTLADMAVTQLMNSRVTNGDFGRIGAWLRGQKNIEKLETVRSALVQLEGLQADNGNAVRLLGELVDGMVGQLDDEGLRELYGIREAKIFKWLAAWAPAHVPMIDNYVAAALREMKKEPAGPPSGELLLRFRQLLTAHLQLLADVGQWLGKELREHLGGHAVPPVRVLDDLLWCDWWGCWGERSGFKKWIVPDDRNGVEYVLTREGIEVNARYRDTIQGEIAAEV